MFEIGRVSRVQGGVRIAGNHSETSYRVRMCEAAAAKQAIGIGAARIVQSGTTILSIGGIEARHGFLDFEPDKATFQPALCDRARRSVVVVDRSRCDRNGTQHVADFSVIADRVTDATPAGHGAL